MSAINSLLLIETVSASSQACFGALAVTEGMFVWMYIEEPRSHCEAWELHLSSILERTAPSLETTCEHSMQVLEAAFKMNSCGWTQKKKKKILPLKPPPIHKGTEELLIIHRNLCNYLSSHLSTRKSIKSSLRLEYYPIKIRQKFLRFNKYFISIDKSIPSRPAWTGFTFKKSDKMLN